VVAHLDRHTAAPRDVAELPEVRHREALLPGSSTQLTAFDLFAGGGVRLVDGEANRGEPATVGPKEGEQFAMRVDDGDRGTLVAGLELYADGLEDAPRLFVREARG
jgi:hypothetical protein